MTRVSTYKFSREARKIYRYTVPPKRYTVPSKCRPIKFLELECLSADRRLILAKRRGNSFCSLILNNTSLLKKRSHMLIHVNKDLYINEYYIKVFIYVNKDFKFITEWNIHI